MYADFPSDSGLGLEDGHVPSFWILLYTSAKDISKSSGLPTFYAHMAASSNLGVLFVGVFIDPYGFGGLHWGR